MLCLVVFGDHEPLKVEPPRFQKSHRANGESTTFGSTFENEIFLISPLGGLDAVPGSVW